MDNITVAFFAMGGLFGVCAGYLIAMATLPSPNDKSRKGGGYEHK